MYFIRLDDASEYMGITKWRRMEQLLDKYNIKPIFGIIPHNEDPELLDYKYLQQFWGWVQDRVKTGWVPAMHGYNHVYETKCGGLNPVNQDSEFAGVPYEQQCKKIKAGYQILKEHDIEPEIFFAPSHTFDENTLKALESETPIRVISDTIANDVYYDEPFYFIPQQSGQVRKLLFKTATFCYHPNIMGERDFAVLESFLKKHTAMFGRFSTEILKKRKQNAADRFLRYIYFARRH